MNTIWKFALQPGNYCDVEIPIDSQVLCAMEQNDGIYIWAIVDPNKPKVTRHFQVIGTGWEFDNRKRNYISSVQLANVNLIFHIFEILE